MYVCICVYEYSLWSSFGVTHMWMCSSMNSCNYTPIRGLVCCGGGFSFLQQLLISGWDLVRVPVATLVCQLVLPLCRSCLGDYIYYCDFKSTAFLSHIENTIWQQASLSCGPYDLSSLSSVMFSEPWVERYHFTRNLVLLEPHSWACSFLLLQQIPVVQDTSLCISLWQLKKTNKCIYSFNHHKNPLKPSGGGTCL